MTNRVQQSMQSLKDHVGHLTQCGERRAYSQNNEGISCAAQYIQSSLYDIGYTSVEENRAKVEVQKFSIARYGNMPDGFSYLHFSSFMNHVFSPIDDTHVTDSNFAMVSPEGEVVPSLQLQNKQRQIKNYCHWLSVEFDDEQSKRPFVSLKQCVQVKNEEFRERERLIDESEFIPAQNIVATLPGKEAATLYLVAHYDSLNGPGAVDNASGVAVVLELARNLFLKAQEETLPWSVKFVLTTAEENWDLGATYFVFQEQKTQPPKGIVLNVDMVGGKMENPSLSIKTDAPLKEIEEAFPKNSPLCLDFKQYEGENLSSDEEAFNGWMPWVSVGQANDYGPIHSSDDTADQIDFSALYDTQQILEAAVQRLSNIHMFHEEE